jgi:hypothetical protein
LSQAYEFYKISLSHLLKNNVIAVKVKCFNLPLTVARKTLLDEPWQNFSAIYSPEYASYTTEYAIYSTEYANYSTEYAIYSTEYASYTTEYTNLFYWHVYS